MRQAEGEYHDAIRQLHAGGASPHDIAAALDIGEQAVRRILGIEEEHDLLRCSFCSKSQTEVRKLIAGPGVYICEACAAAAEASAGDRSEKCSFCGKSGATVTGMAPGPNVRICDECLDLCREIIRQEQD